MVNLYIAHKKWLYTPVLRMTNSRQREARSVTHEAMEKLHKALETMPAEGK